MITLQERTIKLISNEMENIPKEFHKPFNSMHEGLGVLREEYKELEDEIFWGFKQAKTDAANRGLKGDDLKDKAYQIYKTRVREEAVQLAAMACRIIQELTTTNDH